MESSRTGPARWLLGAAFAAPAAVALALLVTPSCVGYDPSLYPSYDVLNPGQAVRVNPLSTYPDPATGRQLFVVDAAFIAWVDELKAEIIKLRKGARQSASHPKPQEQ